jgi:hypothetical protein
MGRAHRLSPPCGGGRKGSEEPGSARCTCAGQGADPALPGRLGGLSTSSTPSSGPSGAVPTQETTRLPRGSEGCAEVADRDEVVAAGGEGVHNHGDRAEAVVRRRSPAAPHSPSQRAQQRRKARRTRLSIRPVRAPRSGPLLGRPRGSDLHPASDATGGASHVRRPAKATWKRPLRRADVGEWYNDPAKVAQNRHRPGRPQRCRPVHCRRAAR